MCNWKETYLGKNKWWHCQTFSSQNKLIYIVKSIENVLLDKVKSVKVNRKVNADFQAKIRISKKLNHYSLYSFLHTKRPTFMRLYHKNLLEGFNLLRKNYKYGYKRHWKACKTKQLHWDFSENTSFYYLNDHYVNFRAILRCRLINQSNGKLVKISKKENRESIMEKRRYCNQLGQEKRRKLKLCFYHLDILDFHPSTTENILNETKL